MENREFIIGGKLYSTGDSVLLCQSIDHLAETSEQLFHTSKGNYFKITKANLTGRVKVDVLDKDAAFRFMDENTNDIIKENYIKVFGNVERG